MLHNNEVAPVQVCCSLCLDVSGTVLCSISWRVGSVEPRSVAAGPDVVLRGGRGFRTTPDHVQETPEELRVAHTRSCEATLFYKHILVCKCMDT